MVPFVLIFFFKNSEKIMPLHARTMGKSARVSNNSLYIGVTWGRKPLLLYPELVSFFATLAHFY